LQEQTRKRVDSSRWPRKDKSDMQPTAKCVASWLNQWSPNYSQRGNYVIDEQKINLRKFLDWVEDNIHRNNHIT